ncbi:MAG TPA: tRNA glutamyl-Q(34) synthetase GluQRS [Dongiaceae bacterium]|jgi:glutamyl-Q tRNA(Asp) synthetase|nr:tRNA glutamyl-Q(34) synthetase GluQRS [Dongiaceae bacterium]
MPTSLATVTRFAPSPTGRLHLGHAFSALFADQAARREGGRFLLRIEDIDRARCRAEFEAGIYEDLAWLGLTWETPVRRQSEHLDDYRSALDRLASAGFLYPCFCSRKEIEAEIARSASAPQGPDGPLYPGTCRGLSATERASRIADGRPYALRLDVSAALAATGRLSWHDLDRGELQAEPGLLGDVVLGRRDAPASYHLAVTLDDHRQGISLVTRGEDLLSTTHIHRLLQALLKLDTPAYRHHRLLTNERGERLAKRDGAEALAALRAAGETPARLRARLGF